MSPRVCVIGLGKMGLPIAAQYASRHLEVIGCDINPDIVALTNRGQAHITEEPGLADRVAEAHARGLLRATTDTAAAVAESDVVVVIVQVGLTSDQQPDLTAITSATGDLARGLRDDTLVIYETTLPVGSTRHFGGMIEAWSGLRMGVDFQLVFSPERVMSGSVFSDLQRYPKVVGGIDEASTERAREFYELALNADVMSLSSPEAAEMSKLVETTYRDVNIAFANEIARYADHWEINVTEVITAANSQPHSHVHLPGVGVGGHCIPVYPHFLLNGNANLTLVRHSRAINDGMASYGVEQIRAALGDLAGRRVLILGLAYRGNVKEASNSSAIRLIRELRRRGGVTLLHDPLFSPQEIEAAGAIPVKLHPAPAVDAIVLQANHAQYSDLDFTAFPGLKVLLDGRNVLDPERISNAGIQYLGIGSAGYHAAPEPHPAPQPELV